MLRRGAIVIRKHIISVSVQAFACQHLLTQALRKQLQRFLGLNTTPNTNNLFFPLLLTPKFVFIRWHEQSEYKSNIIDIIVNVNNYEFLCVVNMCMDAVFWQMTDANTEQHMFCNRLLRKDKYCAPTESFIHQLTSRMFIRN